MTSSSLPLEGKVALVTGASSGIGTATAVAMGAAGARVVLTGRDGSRLEAAAERVPGERRIVRADLADEGTPGHLVRDALDAFGALDVLVHSAALFEPVPFGEVTPESLDRQWRTNVRAPYLLTQEALPHFRQGAAVVFVSSIAGHVGFQSSSAYCATKGAIELLAKALSLELSPRGVRVNVVAPGNVRTPMNEELRLTTDYESVQSAQTPAGRFGEPEEIAAAVVFLASEAASFVHGASLLVDGGWTAR